MTETQTHIVDYGYELECIDREILISDAHFTQAAFEQSRFGVEYSKLLHGRFVIR